MEKNNEIAVRNALRLIVANQHKKALNYCVEYAYAGLHMTGENLRTQCIYVVLNMTHWRGEVAKEVRATLKKFIEKKGEM